MPPALYLLLCLGPLLPGAHLLWQAAMGSVGPDVGKVLVSGLGLWAMRMLWLTLLVRPVHERVSVSLIRLRRVFGLYALGYALLHLCAYWWFYLSADPGVLLRELVKRPYILVGATALAMMLSLGITSNRWARRRMGRYWVRLHWGIYPMAGLVLWHFVWQMKAIGPDAWLYGLLLALLLYVRWPPRLRI